MKAEQRIAKLLKQQHKTIAIAESCTGGLLCHRITNVTGSSKYFKLGLITYADEAKSGLIKIPVNLIKSKGAVSAEVARLMAKNIRWLGRADFGLGITGIAGPGGATPAKPVGLVFIALAAARESRVLKFNFKGSRLEIKRQTSEAALKLLEKSI